jgi:hypothetical protein
MLVHLQCPGVPVALAGPDHQYVVKDTLIDCL